MTLDKRTLEVLIAMGMKPDAVNKTIAEFKKINQQMGILEKDALNLKKSIEIALSHGEDTSELKSQLKVVEDSMSRLQGQMDRTNRSAKDLKENSYYLRDIGQKLSQIGAELSNVGNAILSPLQGAMAAYMEQQTAVKEAGGQMSESAKAYLDAQKQMQSAYIRIGAVVLDKFGPYIDDIANLVGKLADFIEKNPEIVAAAAGLGVTLAALGKIAQTAGSLIMLINAFEGLGLFAEGGLLAGAIPALAAAAPAIGVLIGGAILAEITRRGLNKLMGTDKSFGDVIETGHQAQSLLSPLTPLALALKAMGFDEQAAKMWTFNKSIHGLGDAAEDAAPKIEKTAEEILAAAEANKQFTDALAQYQLETKQASQEYYSTRKNIMDDAHAAELDAERSYRAALTNINTQYRIQIETIAQNYQESQRQAAEQYQQQVQQTLAEAQRAEEQAREDHLEKLRQLEQDHNDNVQSLVRSRDALGLAEENRNYARQVDDENRSYEKEKARREQETQARLAEMARAYQLEREQAAKQYQQQLDDAKKKRDEDIKQQAAQYKLQQEKARADTEKQLRDLEERYKAEQTRSRNAFNAQLADLDVSLLNERNKRTYYYQLALQDADTYMRQWREKMNASGGTASTGTGSASPDAKYSSQSQFKDRMFASLAGRTSNYQTSQVNLQQEISFNGDMSAGNKAQFRTFMRSVALETFAEMM